MGIGDISAFTEQLLSTSADLVNHSPDNTAGQDIDVGVVDSCYRLPEAFENDYAIIDRSRCINSDGLATNEHGVQVFDILSLAAPAATYYLYQAVDGDGRIDPIPFADAVTKAVDDNVDILNISAGKHRPYCTGRECAFCRTAREATARGTIIVAGAGYTGETDRKNVFCPAYAEPVIAVDGVTARCTYTEHQPEGVIDTNLNPPLANWIKKLSAFEEDYPEHSTDEAFCSLRDCGPGGGCEQYQSIQPWEYNPLPAGDKPDVSAPPHYIRALNGDVPYLIGGTSYAAPLVSGAIAWMLGELLNNQLFAQPHEVRAAIRNASQPYPGGDAGRLDAKRTLDQLF